MKDLNFLRFGLRVCAIIAFSFVVSSCSKEDDSVSANIISNPSDFQADEIQQLEEMRAAAKKLLWYLDLEDGCRYGMMISQPEAERLLGINSELYESVVAEFDEINRLTQIELEKAKTTPGYEVVIDTPEELIKANITRIPTRVGENPNYPIHGALKAPGGGVEASWRFFAPLWVEKVRFFVLLNSPATAWEVTCGTVALGQRSSKSIKAIQLRTERLKCLWLQVIQQ